jgi:hemolysin III
MRSGERISVFSHVAGAAAAIAGTIVLLAAARGAADRTAVALVYGCSAVFMFSASSLYHAFKKGEDEISLWRKLDHIAIFFMIAGTYTPMCYIYLTGWWRWSIIIVQWSVVVFGLFFKIFYLNAPRALYTVMYVLMGWVALVPIKQLIDAMPAGSLMLVLAGGIAYTAGAVMYAAKKPVVVPGMFGYHEIFHIFILLGATLHYLMIYHAIRGAVGV